MEDIKLIHLDETDSTNRFLHDYHDEEGRTMTVVFADYQSDGHGQGSNHWESERGKNLTLSLKTHPRNVPANRQFVMLEAMALAIRSVLCLYTDSVTIKWPNDIYWRDRKISGTLSECAVSKGTVKSCIIGIGLNVNQQDFTSDAPNPVSLRQIIGKDTDLKDLLNRLLLCFKIYLERVNTGQYEDMHQAYNAVLYRRNRLARYKDAEGEFLGTIERVEPDGHLVVRKEQSGMRRYAFKEIEFRDL